MRIVIQRVHNASVRVDGLLVSEIGVGLMLLVGVERGDTIEDVEWLTSKVSSLRIFPDEQGIMNLSIKEIGGEILAVSQFTLTASTRKGNRPSYIRAAGPDEAIGLYNKFCDVLSTKTGNPVKKGIFGADMKVSLVNDGPVTIIIDTRLRE